VRFLVGKKPVSSRHRGIITSSISVSGFQRYFNSPSDTVIGDVGSSFQGSAVLGTIFNIIFAHRLGRKKTVFIGALVSVVGSALQAGAAAMSTLLVGRFIGGMAVGILTLTIPMYSAELSPAKSRGL